MYSKNIHRSSEMVVTGDFLKLRKSKETAVHRSGLLSQKHSAITKRSKHVDRAVKVSHGVPSKFKFHSPDVNRPAPMHSGRIVKSKSKRRDSFELELAHDAKSLRKNNKNSKRESRDQRSTCQATLLPREYAATLIRAQSVLQLYLAQIEQIRNENRGLVYENCTLKSRLYQHQKS